MPASKEIYALLWTLQARYGTLPVQWPLDLQAVRVEAHELIEENAPMTPAQLYPGLDLNAPAFKVPIEPGVKPLCDALNALPDVHTLWSCEGHPEVGSRPYATFIGPAKTAFAISRAVGQDGQKAGLHFCWHLTATFRDDGSLQYTIEPNDYRVSRPTWGEWLFARRRWNKRTMANDLSGLAVLIRKMK